jgi:hypothetical protein
VFNFAHVLNVLNFMQKRVAIVTGVSRLNGIGKAICIELATGQIIHSEGGFIREKY